MEAKKVPEVMLNSGYKMPMIDFVTSHAPIEGHAAIVVDAIGIGYRHFDTGFHYGAEEAIGQASLMKGRYDLFITSKLWCSDARTNLVLPALKPTLQCIWEAMEECQKRDLAKSIGARKFGSIKLTQLLEKATIPPAVNQVEMNTSWRQAKLLQFCRDKGIHVTACSPLGAYKDIWGSDAVIENRIL
ncbi:Aldo/keto reductase/potassium channel subunit beta [Parasponia andersonii]|uniref:Aldo/keto reductase/potassium channel subunit beta n=1 Tax=Parasponia andersonii TaxID=3476 RepID=A0A2P5B9F4_PARAD|nr:Aldo/keto reductase/potassium channel subunit beta [Parasponia andersonii]